MENQIQPEQKIEQNNSQLTKKERRQMKREEKRKEQEKVKEAKGRKNMLLWGGLIILAALGAFFLFRYLFTTPKDGTLAADILKTCVNHTSPGMHIHPDLRIEINGEREDIPANIGISGNCMRPLHTHDSMGKIHVEFPRAHNFTLGDFFHVWDKPFPDAITMTVNGQANTEYENLILKDHDQIEIEYAKQEGGERL